MPDVPFLNGDPMSRVIEITVDIGLPFKNDTSATVSKNKPQPSMLSAKKVTECSAFNSSTFGVTTS